MTRIDSTKVLWRVETRAGRDDVWHKRGLFETREAARYQAWVYRTGGQDPARVGLGFGNCRVVRHISGKGK